MVLGGGADYSVGEPGEPTPLAAADTPNLDRISSEGRVGLVRNIPRGFAPESGIAMMSVLGYDPARHYPGRAALEAAAMGIHLAPGEVAFRCDLVTVADGTMADPTAGRISTREAGILLALLRKHLQGPDLRIVPGSGHRALIIYNGAPPMDAEVTPPHEIIGLRVEDNLPEEAGSDILRDLMRRSCELLEDHEVNRVRVDLGENPANMLWIWGRGKRTPLPQFAELHGKTGAAIAAAEYIIGLALEIGCRVSRAETPTTKQRRQRHSRPCRRTT